MYELYRYTDLYITTLSIKRRQNATISNLRDYFHVNSSAFGASDTIIRPRWILSVNQGHFIQWLRTDIDKVMYSFQQYLMDSQHTDEKLSRFNVSSNIISIFL